MRRRPPHRTPSHSLGRTLVVSVTAVVLLFGVLLVASYPVASAALFGAGVVALALTRVLVIVRAREAICVPGTNVCVRITTN